MTQVILYTSDDGKSHIQLRADGQTVWLTQREMAELFAVSTDNVGLPLKNIFAEGELDAVSVTEESSVTAAGSELAQQATSEESSVVQIEGGLKIQRLLSLANFSAIILDGELHPVAVVNQWLTTAIPKTKPTCKLLNTNSKTEKTHHDRTRSKTTGRYPLEHCRYFARGDERGRFPRLYALLPVPALSV